MATKSGFNSVFAKIRLRVGLFWAGRKSYFTLFILNIVNGGNYSGPRFNEVAGDRPNLFVKWRVRYIENLDITNLRGKDQNVRYIEVIVND